MSENRNAARRVVRGAAAYARTRGGQQITELDVLGALLTEPGSDGGRLLGALGLTAADLADLSAQQEDSARRGGLNDADVAALAELGIDVDGIVERAEQSWGEGALRPPTGGRRIGSQLPLSSEVKRLLVRSLRQSREVGVRGLREEHLVLGLLAGRTQLVEALAQRGVTWTAARTRLTATATGPPDH